jgi:magnesium-transporting ATPase (P-type)
VNSALVRIFWALLIHVGWFILAAGLLYVAGAGESALSDATRDQYRDNPALIDQIRTDALWHLLNWAFLSLAASWLLASLWLFIAERQRPRTPAEGAAKRGLWVILLLVTLAAMAAIGWSRLAQTGVTMDLAASTMTTGILTVSFTVLLAYFTATAMSVKQVMRPSVPFSSILPNVRGKA